MNYYLKIGVIRPDKLESWNKNEEPFEILDDWKDIEKINWLEFMANDSIFTEKVQVEWESFAYKATKKQVKQFIEKTHCVIEDINELPDENLGIVFIEMS